MSYFFLDGLRGGGGGGGEDSTEKNSGNAVLCYELQSSHLLITPTICALCDDGCSSIALLVKVPLLSCSSLWTITLQR